jgi:hypothetical protein
MALEPLLTSTFKGRKQAAATGSSVTYIQRISLQSTLATTIASANMDSDVNPDTSAADLPSAADIKCTKMITRLSRKYEATKADGRTSQPLRKDQSEIFELQKKRSADDHHLEEDSQCEEIIIAIEKAILDLKNFKEPSYFRGEIFAVNAKYQDVLMWLKRAMREVAFDPEVFFFGVQDLADDLTALFVYDASFDRIISFDCNEAVGLIMQYNRDCAPLSFNSLVVEANEREAGEEMLKTGVEPRAGEAGSQEVNESLGRTKKRRRVEHQ